jgi:sulfur-carrier protein
MLRIVYFARVREAVGVDGEQVEVEAGTGIAELIDRLARQSERHAAAFSDRNKLRFALDQKMVRAGALLDGAKELAIFPPVTGG